MDITERQVAVFCSECGGKFLCSEAEANGPAAVFCSDECANHAANENFDQYEPIPDDASQ
jgi:endogenous inhibitor of DNA gyrase (YacG/DUF329 family)